MVQNVSLTFVNDQNWFLAVDVSGLAAYYDLSVGIFRMQARSALGVNAIAYAWSSSPSEDTPGTITYTASPPLLAITAPYTDMRNLAAGDYVYGLQYQRDVPYARFVVLDLWSGALTVGQGSVYT